MSTQNNLVDFCHFTLGKKGKEKNIFIPVNQTDTKIWYFSFWSFPGTQPIKKWVWFGNEYPKFKDEDKIPSNNVFAILLFIFQNLDTMFHSLFNHILKTSYFLIVAEFNLKLSSKNRGVFPKFTPGREFGYK